jgi:transcriptional regulator with XRE-family HTH domain
MWKKLRIQAKMTQKEFAERVGYSQARISQYENGYRTMPKKLQIEYLKLRNNEEDKKIIKFLKGEN